MEHAPDGIGEPACFYLEHSDDATAMECMKQDIRLGAVLVEGTIPSLGRLKGVLSGQRGSSRRCMIDGEVEGGVLAAGNCTLA